MLRRPQQYLHVATLLYISVLIQFLTLAVLYFVCPDIRASGRGDRDNHRAIVLCVLLQSIQWAIAFYGFSIVLKNVMQRRVALGKATKMYVIQILAFAGLYLCFFLIWHELNNDPLEGNDAFLMTSRWQP